MDKNISPFLARASSVQVTASSFTAPFLKAVAHAVENALRSRPSSNEEREELDSYGVEDQLEYGLDGLLDDDRALRDLQKAHAAEWYAFNALQGSKQIALLKPHFKKINF